MRKWVEELKEQPWSKKAKSNDQPAFNWALLKTAGQVRQGHLNILCGN
jgi:rhamnogalacturonan II specific xylosyltransferase